MAKDKKSEEREERETAEKREKKLRKELKSLIARSRRYGQDEFAQHLENASEVLDKHV
ncbi:hypothetical protein ACMA5I_12305 [Paracoccaceae bacterium GXU_MW_L88]